MLRWDYMKINEIHKLITYESCVTCSERDVLTLTCWLLTVQAEKNWCSLTDTLFLYCFLLYHNQDHIGKQVTITLGNAKIITLGTCDNTYLVSHVASVTLIHHYASFRLHMAIYLFHSYKKGYPIFQSHPSNFKVTGDKKCRFVPEAGVYGL